MSDKKSNDSLRDRALAVKVTGLNRDEMYDLEAEFGKAKDRLCENIKGRKPRMVTMTGKESELRGIGAMNIDSKKSNSRRQLPKKDR